MKFPKFIPATLLLVIVAASCSKKDLPTVPPSDVQVTVSYASDYDYFSVTGIKVEIKNGETGQSYQAVTDNNGAYTFAQVPAGIYTVAASIAFSASEFTALSGIAATDSVFFSGTLTNQVVNAGSVNTISLTINTGKTGDLVIKQIYYAGSHTSNGASFRDQFIEIYNNTSETIYADSLYFSQIEGLRSPAGSGNAIYAYQPNGQYDWQLAFGMPANIDANNDYVYLKTIYRIPGNGTQYPILPGQSIIIAQNAINHQAPYTNNNGTLVTPKDPSLTTDLSNADFECFLNDGFASDINNPAVPDLHAIYTYGAKDMVLDNPGRDGYIIFRYKEDIGHLPQYHYPRLDGAAPTADKLFYQLPVSAIVDAVEVQHAVPTSRFPKKLLPAQDAGFTFVPSGQYSSQSVIRKTKRTVNGRVVLQDTNNSTEDFDYFDRANPGGFK